MHRSGRVGTSCDGKQSGDPQGPLRHGLPGRTTVPRAAHHSSVFLPQTMDIPEQDIRLWLKEEDTWSRLERKDEQRTLEDLELQSGDYILCETRLPPRTKTSSNVA